MTSGPWELSVNGTQTEKGLFPELGPFVGFSFTYS